MMKLLSFVDSTVVVLRVTSYFIPGPISAKNVVSFVLYHSRPQPADIELLLSKPLNLSCS